MERSTREGGTNALRAAGFTVEGRAMRTVRQACHPARTGAGTL
ncbi:hypothetical protein [Streptomyces silvisoli]|uniref:Uncharacterized protein n=1 Tax=Streptomyces silvisoli TaxID=3034235 RepID=A0ABT5ZHM3_9ACTN|nr:hypothetical protein [Streptomyces silvisoli]MDF3288518.1 hypothetical protein [Streptomyces silvisoli]